MEDLFVRDGPPGHPWHFFCRLLFRGRPRPERLDQALAVARARHPLLAATVRATARGPVWHHSPAPLPPVRWVTREPGEDLPPSVPLDLGTRPGLEVTAVVGAETSELVLQFTTPCVTAWAPATSSMTC
jgi:hypothetical protein